MKEAVAQQLKDTHTRRDGDQKQLKKEKKEK